MKSITKILDKSNLTPRERSLLLIQNDVNRELGNGESLTDADRYALSDSWIPLNNYEVKEYNMYMAGWKLEGLLYLDMQTHYLNTEISFLKASKIVDFALWSQFESFKRTIDNVLKSDKNAALENLLKNSGITYEQIIHQLTLENISDELKQDLLALSPDLETSSSYFLEEEKIYNFLKDKVTLTKIDRENLAKIILSEVRWDGVKFIKDKGLDPGYFIFGGYFAGIPLLSIAKKWADKNSVEYNDNEELKSLLANNENVNSILHKTLSDWIEEGLFTKEFNPLYLSENFETCNNLKTKKPHKQVFFEWLKVKQEQEKIIQDLIDNGKLEKITKSKKILDYSFTEEIITGVSIYYLENNLSFVNEFKKQIDDLIYISYLVEFMRDHDFVDEYNRLLLFKTFFNKLSKVFEIDLSFKYKKFTEQFYKDFELLKKQLDLIQEKIQENLYTKKDYKYIVDVYTDEMLDEIFKEKELDGIYLKRYEEEFSKNFKNIWEQL